MPLSPDLESDLAAVTAHVASRQEAYLADLFRLLAQPSISAQDIGIRECAALEEALLRQAGLVTRIIETGGEPLVYGEWLASPGQPTILFYGHYDVQPPEPLDAWHSPPFQPEIRDGRIYARGVADNKAQHFSHIAAIGAWMDVTGSLPVNVKVLLEGEEESGSPSFHDAVVANRELLQADIVYMSDGPVSDERYSQIAFGVRGMLYIELRATGPNRDLHSGHWGGVAPNPIWALVHALGTMVDAENRVTIAGYYDNVRAPTPGARAAMEALPFDVASILAGAGIDRLPPPADLPYADRIMAQPTFNLSGLNGGYGGPGSKTIIPSTATAKIDMRLVPDQTPDEIWETVARHVAEHAPSVEVVRMRGGVLPSYTPVEHPLAEPIRRAVERGFGSRPIDIPIVGASLGEAVWTKTLGLPAIHVPYGAPEQANHSPNENYRVERLWQGIHTSAALLAELVAPDGA